MLVLDDTTLDKPYAKKMDLVTRHWSGKHKRVVWGINLQTLVWSGFGEGDRPCVIPCDMRLYEAGGPTKNEQSREMLAVASERGSRPECVLFDAWYSGLDNLKAVRDLGWHFLTRLPANRTVNADRTGHLAVSEVEVGGAGGEVWLKGFGLVRLFRTVSRDGRAGHWATNRLAMTEAERSALERGAWGIESYHRSLKQHCGAERSHVRSAIGQANHLLLSVRALARALGHWRQANHLLLSVRAYLRLEVHRIRTGVSHFEAKASIIREAMRAFLAHPTFSNLATA